MTDTADNALEAAADYAVTHKKFALDCLLLRATLAECQANYWRTYPQVSTEFRAAAASLCIARRDALMQEYEQARREFLRTHRRRAVLSRVPGQLRRLISRLFCQPTPLRHTGEPAATPATGDTP
jgi:hypothetical protein